MKSDFNGTTRFAGHLVLAAALVTALLEPGLLQAQVVDCSTAGRNYPATTVPECVDLNGFAVGCGTASSIRLWPPNNFRPASGFPNEPLHPRDSTDRIGGLSVPGRKKGHELFKTVDIVTVGNASPRLYVSYNAGFQVWNIATDPANPAILSSRDGWEGEFLNFPGVGEVLNFIADVSALNVDPTTDLVGVAGIDPVGPSFWEFKTTTNQLRQLYQDTPTGARQVRLIKHGTTVYAFVGADNGLAVYNVTAARALSSPCLDQQGTSCPTVFRGFVGDTGGLVRSFIDTLHVPASAGKPERIFVSAAGGLFTDLELWEVSNPQAPGNAVRRFSGFRNTLGSALFSYDGHYYMAFVSEENGFNNERLRIFSIDGCISGSTCSVVDGSMVEAINPITLAANQSTTWDFLTYSKGPQGTPYLYYGVGSTNVSGPDLEQLFDLSTLRPPFPRPGLPEITAGGGAYTDPCNGATIRYWSHYYSRNYHGLNEMVPWGGKFSANGYFYRAAHSILDVHVLGEGTTPGTGNIKTDVVNPQSEYWMSDLIAYRATATGACSASPLQWVWPPSSSLGDVARNLFSEAANDATYSFDCQKASGRCSNTLVSIQADNSAASCADANLQAATITVKDPEIAIVDAGTGATDTFEECQTVPFAANLAGRAPVWWEWQIDGNPLDGCSSSYSATDDLAAAVVGCDVPAELISTDTIFRDSFESGGFGAWDQVTIDGALVFSNPAAKAVGPVLAELHVWDSFNKALPAKDVEVVPFTIVESGTPAFSGPPQESVAGSSATLTHAATNATSWAWEIQDDAGPSTCTFPGVGSKPCFTETTGTDTTTHVWLTAGTYEYRVTISNCGSGIATRTDQVTVEAGVQPTVLAFALNGVQAGCCGSPNFGFTCSAGVEVNFVVQMAENASYVFQFDWARPSLTGTPTFTAQNAASNDPSVKEWYFKHTFTQTGGVYPIVRAQNGGFTADRDFIAVPITIVNGSCN